ncbi:hemin uptake protein HemP [Hydrogenophaga sp. MI9]|uniref:hemin uptake protein HemP n=1 Tax=Hydrogenophaga sp. MI9 TaxID=3453719 RepID=UPI003EECA78C
MNRQPCSNETAAAVSVREEPVDAPSTRAPSPVLDSQAVLQGRSSVAIEHNGAVYRLQTTRQGKLILTK